jgi:hypothetical protein
MVCPTEQDIRNKIAEAANSLSQVDTQDHSPFGTPRAYIIKKGKSTGLGVSHVVSVKISWDGT